MPETYNLYSQDLNEFQNSPLKKKKTRNYLSVDTSRYNFTTMKMAQRSKTNMHKKFAKFGLMTIDGSKTLKYLKPSRQTSFDYHPNGPLTSAEYTAEENKILKVGSIQ